MRSLLTRRDKGGGVRLRKRIECYRDLYIVVRALDRDMNMLCALVLGIAIGALLT